MKSLRDLILNEHAGAEDKLDRMWLETLEPTLQPHSESPRANPVVAFVLTAWRELFWSSRYAFAGIAAVWLVALIVNEMTVAPVRRTAPTLAANPEEILMALQARSEAEVLWLVPRQPKPARRQTPPLPAPGARRDEATIWRI